MRIVGVKSEDVFKKQDFFFFFSWRKVSCFWKVRTFRENQCAEIAAKWGRVRRVRTFLESENTSGPHFLKRLFEG
ncbi:hypothetical protein AN642_01610 [Epulopiscium sp. SCG-B10WGA-EpuloA2]|nr:hypothetical protein AN642_01610 [Epulopiscium sp. SCG-B10WGA-EpuloA2]